VVTCPCALSLAAPSALLAAAGALGKRGVLVRRLDALEALAHVDQVYFDKTGTLTEPELRVAQIWTQSGAWSFEPGIQAEAAVAPADQALWRSLLSLAALSQHPLSQSLVKASPSGFQPVAWHDAKELAGKGIQAQDERGWVWRLGGRDWVLEGGVGLPGATEARVWMAARDGQGVINPHTLMAVTLDESIRAEAPAAIQGIEAQGCKAWMLSGDHAERVASAAALLGQGAEPMAVAQAHASPEDKLRVITQAQSSGHTVAVVGDGINDAPVLAQAQVSIALDQGAALAQSQADLIILGGRLTGVPYAIALSRQTQRVVRQNLAWAATYNLACIPLALLGYLPPWLAGLGMALSSLGVVLNALRLGAFRA
jgi:Cu2+-exporting ATPase